MTCPNCPRPDLPWSQDPTRNPCHDENGRPQPTLPDPSWQPEPGLWERLIKKLKERAR